VKEKESYDFQGIKQKNHHPIGEEFLYFHVGCPTLEVGRTFSVLVSQLFQNLKDSDLSNRSKKFGIEILIGEQAAP